LTELELMPSAAARSQAIPALQPFLAALPLPAPVDPYSGSGPCTEMVPQSSSVVATSIRVPDEFVYRIDRDGDVAYKFSLPKYAGPLHDGMVLGQDDVGFTARGGMLIAFDVRDGKELWNWASGTPEIEVFAALANGGCAVQTPTALVEVDNATQWKEIVKGKAMMDWQSQMFVQQN
jgi:outer membrane protein assembly factor BamB